MRNIDSFFEENIEQTLYHYTSIGALLGITRNKCLWASNVYYLSDSKEIVYACEVFETGVRTFLESENNNEIESEFLRQLGEWVKTCKTVHFNIFVFSLSESPSLLSQWRSYTPHGKGVSIGISVETINGLVESPDIRIAKCIYDQEEQIKLLFTLIKKMLLTFRKRPPEIDMEKAHKPTCFHEFLEKFRSEVLQTLAIIKHPAFSEEKEWRLVSRYYPSYVVPEIKLREGASMLIPYIEMNFKDTRPFFDKVILGPSAHQNLSMSTLTMYLSQTGACTVVQNCLIPYREW